MLDASQAPDISAAIPSYLESMQDMNEMVQTSETEKKRPLMFELTLWLLYIICFILKATWRVRIVGMDRRRMAVSSSPTGSFLIASYHENAIAGILTHAGQKICTMVSHSKDGEIVTFICQKLGIKSVRGSSSRGGKAVRDEMVEVVKSGYSGAITVDGPRGPRRVLKNGIVDIARKTGAPVMPLVSVGDSYWVLSKTWDQTRVPKPFARVLVYYGTPITVSRDTNEEQFKEYLAKISDAMTRDDDLVRLRFDEFWSSATP